MEKWMEDYLRSNRLSYTLLCYILLCSIAFTVLTSAFQLYLGYKKDMKKIEEVMGLIQESYLEPLETSLWSFDLSQLQAQTRGILTLPLIKKVVVQDLSGAQEKQVCSLGNIEDQSFLEQSFSLTHTLKGVNKTIGTLVVYAGLDQIRNQVWQKISTTLFMKVVEIMILSLCILMIFHHMIMKHLRTIERFLGNVDIDNFDRQLILNRRMGKKTDILESIVHAINRIIFQLAMDISNLKNVEEKLTRTNQELVQNREIMEEQERISAAQVAVAEILRDDQDIETLASRLISYLCRQFQAGAGLLYHVDAQTRKIRAVGCYALTISEKEDVEFSVGEGQVGQVVLDKKKILLTPQPDNRLRINSALGQALPGEILIYPFLRDGHVVSVMEMGSFIGFKLEQIALLDQISESVAIAMESAMVRTQKALLDGEIQQQADELKTQDLAFRHSEEKFRLLFNLWEHPMLLVDVNGIILDVNKVMLEFTGLSLSDVQGGFLWEASWWADKQQTEYILSHAFPGQMGLSFRRQSFRVIGKQGDVSTLSFILRPMDGQSGVLWGFVMEGTFPVEE